MAGPVEIYDFSQADEVREFPRGRSETVRTSQGGFGRVLFEPGWRWSESLRPIVKTDLCQLDHFLYGVSGTLHVQFPGGEEFDVGPGTVVHIPPGHDAWVVGDEPVTLVDLLPDISLGYAEPAD